MNIAALAAELTVDTLVRGYSGMSDVEAATDLNTVYRTRNKTSMSGDALFAATDTADFAALTDHQQQIWLAFCGRDSLDPTGASNVALVKWVFGETSDTLTALAAARSEAISRAVELGLGHILPGDVQIARAA